MVHTLIILALLINLGSVSMIPPMAVQDISLEDLRKECRMGKNVAYLFSDRSKALAQAYVLKKARRHSYYVYAKINIYD